MSLKSFIKTFLILAVIILNGTNVFAVEDIEIAENSVLTLKDCIRIALHNSPKLKQNRHKVDIAKYNVNKVQSAYFPELGANTGFGYSYSKKDNMSKSVQTSNNGAPISNTSDYSTGVKLSQLIYSFGKTRVQANEKKFYKIVADMNLEENINSTVYNVKKNYYTVLAAKASIDVQKAYVHINERQYKRVKALFEEGLKSKIDLVNAEVYLSDSKISLITAENQYDAAIIDLNNSMYVSSFPNYQIANAEAFNTKSKSTPINLLNVSNKKDKYELPTMEKGAAFTTSIEKREILENYEMKKYQYSLEESLEHASKHRPDLKAYVATRDAVLQALKYSQIQYFPNLKADAQYQNHNYRDYNSNSYSLGATLDVPLINARKIKNDVSIARREVDIAEEAVTMITKDINYSVQKAYVNLLQLEKKIPLTRIKVKEASENLELADGRYDVGLGNFIELQDAKVNYNKAQQEYVKAVYDYNVAKAKLEYEIALPEDVEAPAINKSKAMEKEITLGDINE